MRYLILFTIFLIGCSQNSDKDLLMDAQICINSAKSRSTALSCVKVISHLNTPEANDLKCSAHFIELPVLAIFGKNDTLSIVTALNLGTDIASTHEVHRVCSGSNYKYSKMYGEVSLISAAISGFNENLVNVNVEDMRSFIEDLKNDILLFPDDNQETIEVIGAAVKSLSGLSCDANDVFSQKVCEMTGGNSEEDLLSKSNEYITNKILSFLSAQ